MAHGIATLLWPLGQLELSSAGAREWQSNHDDDSLCDGFWKFSDENWFFSLSLFLSDSFYRTQFDHLSRLWSRWRWRNKEEAEGVSEHLKIITVRWRGLLQWEKLLEMKWNWQFESAHVYAGRELNMRNSRAYTMCVWCESGINI